MVVPPDGEVPCDEAVVNRCFKCDDGELNKLPSDVDGCILCCVALNDSFDNGRKKERSGVPRELRLLLLPPVARMVLSISYALLLFWGFLD